MPSCPVFCQPSTTGTDSELCSSICSSLVAEDGSKKASVEQAPAVQPNGAATGNNYYRAEGQNVGNFMTDRPSSRVLAPPGGGSQISFGHESSTSPGAKVQLCSVRDTYSAEQALHALRLALPAETSRSVREGHKSLHGWRQP